MTADDAVTHVLVEDPERDPIERSPRGGDLREHIDAVAVFLDHAGHSADLSLRA